MVTASLFCGSRSSGAGNDTKNGRSASWLVASPCVVWLLNGSMSYLPAYLRVLAGSCTHGPGMR